MTTSGISSSSLFNYENQSVQNNVRQFQQEFQQRGQDLQSGNISAAQQDYSNIQQDFQNRATEGHHHHHGGGGGGSSEIAQLFDQLGQNPQSGNLSSAQQVFATLQQDLQQYGVNSQVSLGLPQSQLSSNAVSVNA